NSSNCNNANCVAIASDVDGDGIPDIVYTNYNNNTVSISIGNGDGSFLAPVSYAAGTNPGFIAVGDFNGDGVPDLAVSNTGSNTVGVFLGNGDGTFQPQVVYGAGVSPEGVVVGDFNGDGIADMLVVNGNNNTLSVLLGNGDGTFQAQITTLVGSHAPSAVAVADFDGDGILDVAVSITSGTAASSETAIFLGNGNGTFESLAAYSPAESSSIAAADFNQDGIPDLVYSNHGGNTVSVMLGNGDGTFQTAVPYTVGSNVGSVAVGDFNVDGNPDIVAPSGNLSGGTTAILFGNGDGTFQPQVSYAAAGNGVAVADLNGDGLPDVVAINDQLSILLDAQISNYSASGISFTGSAGEHNVVASYPGISPYTASTSSPVGLTSSNTTPTLTVVSSGTPSTFGVSVTFTATITSGLTGTVRFYDAGTSIGTGTISGTTATLTMGTLAAGTHSITASWAGNTTYSAVTSSAITQVVNLPRPTLTVATSGTPSNYGGSVILTATISSGPTGTITFYDGTTSIGTGTISGTTATVTLSTLTPGVHAITAGWAGSTTYAQITSNAITQVVNKATPTLTLSTSGTPSSFNGSVTFTATISGGATGAVRFYDAGTTIGSGHINGSVATLTMSTLAVGTHSITASWAGNADYAPLTSSAVTQMVNKATPTLGVATSGTPSTDGGLVTLTATISSGPIGSITFYDGGTSIGTAPISSNTATFATSTLPSGSHTITAGWLGDGNYVAVTSSSITQTVYQNGSVTQVSSGINPVTYGQNVTFRALVNTEGGVPTGTVTFKDNGTTIGSAAVSPISTTNLLPYSQQFGGVSWSWYCGSTSNVTVNTSAITAPDGTNTATGIVVPNSLTCGGSGAWGAIDTIPTGLTARQTYTVSVWLRGQHGGEPVSFGLNDCVSGNASLTTSWQRYTFTFPEISSNVATCETNEVRGFQVIDNSVPNATFYVWGAQVEASSAEGPYITTTASAQTGSGGVASFTTNSLVVGTHSITASYSGDSSYPASSSTALSEIVGIIPVIASLSPSSGTVGTAVTITGSSFGSTPGEVTFNGVAATVSSWSTSEIIAIVPQNSASGPVVVTVGGIQSNGEIFTQLADNGTVSLSVNGSVIASIDYSSSATPSSLAENLATAASSSLVSVSAVGDQIYLESKGIGAATDYSYSVQTSYDNTDFGQPSFSASPLSGTLDAGQNQNTAATTVYSFTTPSAGGYDGVGNLLSYKDSVMGQWSFEYDTLNRLAGAVAEQSNNPDKYYCWGYDSFGNRTVQGASNTAFQAGSPTCTFASGPTVSISSTLAKYTPNNQLMATAQAPAGPLYDASGDETSDGVNTYLYDAEGRICAVSSAPVAGLTTYTGYVYNAEGQRVGKGSISSMSCDVSTNGFQPTNDYVIGPGGEQLTELDTTSGSMAWAHTNVFAAGQLIATYDPDGLHFHLSDPLGTRRVQTDYAGVLEQTCSSLPFGDGLSCTGSIQAPTEHHFTGKERDTESGLDYFGARYYASSMGRFMSPDWSAQEEPVPYATMDDPQSLNLYNYTRNNPLSGTDPDGHCCDIKDLFVGAVTGFGTYLGAEAGATAGALTGTFVEPGGGTFGGGVGGGLLGGATGGAIANKLANSIVNALSSSNSSDQSAPATGPAPAAAASPSAPLPDDANVVRGGSGAPGGGNSAEGIAAGTGTHPSGVTGFSAESAPGQSVGELAKGVPNGQVGCCTVGQVRAAGGDVVSTSGRSPNHATVTGLAPSAASKLLTPTIPNPTKVKPQ
ncbi:Ig-like domain repeat protein, partial [Acidicapsa ligni]|uniref:Ig-like domain repeat protein n=1 Tax=Acidicapsa ligni TaxID=542300 RepID=UPI0021E01A8F